MRSRLSGRFLLPAAFLGAALVPAAADTLSTRYDVSLIGLPVGRAEFKTEISGNAYSVDGTLSSSGLADLLTTIKGTSSVAGRIAGDKLFATRYGLDYKSGKKVYKSDVAFQSGRVASAEVQPKAKVNKDFVPVQPEQLRQVVDPLSGLMLKPVKTPDDLCTRTLPFYDGWSRVDLKFSPAGRKPIETDGFKGEAIACDVRIQPVSGYKVTSSGVKFIVRQTVQIWFAPIGATGIYAPVYARVPTQIGPLTFNASTFAKG
ncbi:hypothetical protein GCM10011390_35880 [Aureimonas endophytica]|uniref:DUF3108 domain-containing protein n=1 Tax=Aureimonas endophytica TaxID=2027858 RepID=A0A916ZUQ7_9HYPH|nr:DUF3108 domain-containing protein [Aureimonas endophytica]GGE13605.1 hypothetical protein GCM10011390_35880 [Aureimonas endophytica]